MCVQHDVEKSEADVEDELSFWFYELVSFWFYEFFSPVVLTQTCAIV